MGTQDINNQIKEKINKDIKMLKEEVGQFIAQANGNTDIELDLDLLKSYIELLSREDKLLSAPEIFRSITIAGNIESELDIISDSLAVSLKPSSKKKHNILVGSASPISITSLQGFIGNLKSKIKKISSRLWQFLSQMMNLNEWSVSGNSNLSICGFSGGVTLQLTFKA
ncbi:hypothetical protein DM455_12030 [Legionella pneumophila]|uniref:hypothetical protein n=1 Tax=Legionella pneumophila TaxID=446 RepID=UPI000D7C66F5|nr:hypothetical protein [Legionella pneumophila]MDF1931618.1 hypothetical protein [Legionella pneumophila]PYB43284.1 hypothetical protein DM454_12080 [Legionella pneumophila]PYB48986.1 hypothetical protein DM456_12760 [Legionella pneumophila]PYB62075.1 hypothetical protein DM455_12030 [Legionella pneumophila]TID58040.1 hypothetical protein DIZ40_13185 [Legionella pneumophila]